MSTKTSSEWFCGFLVICFGPFCPHFCQIFPPSGEQQRQELQIFLSYDAKKQSGKVTNINNFLLVFCWKVGELHIQGSAIKSCLSPDVVVDWEMKSGYSTPCTSQQIASLSFNSEDIRYKS